MRRFCSTAAARDLRQFLLTVPDTSSALRGIDHFKSTGLIPDSALLTAAVRSASPKDVNGALLCIEKYAQLGVGLDAEGYTELIRVLSADNQYGKVNMYWNSAKERFTPIPDDLIIAYLEACITCSRSRDAHAMFSSIKHPSGRVLNCMTRVVLKLDKDLNRSNLLLDKIRQNQWPVESKTWDSILRTLGKVGIFSEAFTLFERIEDPSTSNYATFIRMCGDQNRLQDAKRAMAQMESRGLFPDLTVYHALIRAHESTKTFVEPNLLLETIEASHLKPNELTYNFLLMLCRRCRAPLPTIINLFKKMKRSGVVPSIRTYDILIGACVFTCHTREGKLFYDEVVARPDLDHRSKTILATMASLYERAGEHTKASLYQ